MEKMDLREKRYGTWWNYKACSHFLNCSLHVTIKLLCQKYQRLADNPGGGRDTLNSHLINQALTWCLNLAIQISN